MTSSRRESFRMNVQSDKMEAQIIGSVAGVVPLITC